jgi:hypothetical protein
MMRGSAIGPASLIALFEKAAEGGGLPLEEHGFVLGQEVAAIAAALKAC